MLSLSNEEARKLVLLSQKLPSVKQTGSALTATLNAIEHLGYIQIDTISVIERAHHHTLWNRNPRYKSSHLDQLINEKKVFEYWSHAAAYLPMKEYRYTLSRKKAIATGEQKHWYEKDEKLMNEVLRRIECEGPLMAKDFEHSGQKSSEWESKPAKRALECLFMQGDLMISRRNNFHKVYDLTQNVLPKDIDISLPNNKEYTRFLITKYLTANGLAQASQMAYLLKNTKPLVIETLNEMLYNKELLHVKVEDSQYYALPHSLELLNKPLSRITLKILSPFDNLLIQRKRMQKLFGFDYLLECYVPEIKRQYGYFSLPILWDGKLVARMDCKVDRKHSILHINNLYLEENLKKIEAFTEALSKELQCFLEFNNCSSIQLHKTNHAYIKQMFRIF